LRDEDLRRRRAHRFYGAFGRAASAGHSNLHCAVVVHRGRVLGAMPKTYLATYREFYETGHFGSEKDVVGLPRTETTKTQSPGQQRKVEMVITGGYVANSDGDFGLHEANPPSGGMVTKIDLAQF